MKTLALALITTAAMLTSCAPMSLVSGAAYWSEKSREADRLSIEGEQRIMILVKQQLDADVRK